MKNYPSPDDYFNEYNDFNAGKIFYFLLDTGMEIVAKLDMMTPDGFLCAYPVEVTMHNGVITMRDVAQFTKTSIILLNSDKLIFYGHIIPSIGDLYVEYIKKLYKINLNEHQHAEKIDTELVEKIERNFGNFHKGNDTLN